MGRSKSENARAIGRVERDGVITLEELATHAAIGAGSLRRWIIQGKKSPGGEIVHLDGLYSRMRGCWCSSLPALERFRTAVGTG